MSAEVKPGLYVVEVVNTTCNGISEIKGRNSTMDMIWIWSDCLHPLPAATISAEAQAVIDTSLAGHRAAVAAYGAGYADNDVKCRQSHAAACEALIATLTPPDPVAKLRRISALFRICPEEWTSEFDAALAAVEAARGVK